MKTIIFFSESRMVEKGEKGVINWRIVSVVLFVIFVQQLVCSLLYADSPFLIQTYFPGVCESMSLFCVDRS